MELIYLNILFLMNFNKIRNQMILFPSYLI